MYVSEGWYVTSKQNPERGFKYINAEEWLFDLYWICQEHPWILDAKTVLIFRYSLKYKEFVLCSMNQQQKIGMLEYLNTNREEALFYKDLKDPYYGPRFTIDFVNDNFSF